MCVATVMAFGVACPKSLMTLASNSNTTILSHNVIYKLLEMLRVRKADTCCQWVHYKTCHYQLACAMFRSLPENVPIFLLPQGILEALLPSVTEEEVLGTARVIQVYKMTGTKKATIGGSMVEEGQMLRNATFKVIRGEKVRKNI